MAAPDLRSNTSKAIGTASTTWPLTKPSGAANGDMHVLVATYAAPTVAPTLTGWTLVSSVNVASIYRFSTFWKVEDGSAIGTLQWDGSSILNGGILGCYRTSNGNPVKFESNGAPNATDSSNPITTPGVTLTDVNSTAVLLAGGDTDLTGSTGPTSFTAQVSNVAHYLADRPAWTIGSTGSQDWTAGAASNVVGQILVIRDATTGLDGFPVDGLTLAGRARAPMPMFRGPRVQSGARVGRVGSGQ